MREVDGRNHMAGMAGMPRAGLGARLLAWAGLCELDRYVLRQLWASFGFFALVLVGTYWINRAVEFFDRLVADGQSARVFLRFSSLFLPQVLAFMLPVAALAATLHVYNRLLGDSEFVVAEAAGASPLRMARPAFVMVLVLFAYTVPLSHVAVPKSKVEMAAMKSRIDAEFAVRTIDAQRIAVPTSGVAIYVGAREGSTLRNVFLYDARDRAGSVAYTAERAELARLDNSLVLVLHEGTLQHLTSADRRLTAGRFDAYVVDLQRLAQAAPGPQGARSLSTWELLAPGAQLPRGTTRADALFVAFDRIQQSLQVVLYPMLALSVLLLGGHSRSGAFRWSVLAIGVVAAVHVISGNVNALASENPQFVEIMLLPPLATALLALALLRRGRRPSRGAPGALAARLSSGWRGLSARPRDGARAQ